MDEEKQMTFDEAQESAENIFEADAEQEYEENLERTQEQNEQIQGAEDALQEQINRNVEADMQLRNAQQQIIEMQNQMHQIQQQNMALENTIKQMSAVQEENIVSEVMEMPVLDFNSLAFDDEDTAKAKQEEYTRKMAEYSEQKIMKKLEPFIAEAEAGIRQKQETELVGKLSKIPELQGIEELMPQIKRIMTNNKLFANDDIPLEQKMLTAFAIAKGANARNSEPQEVKPPTVEELMDLYNNNPDFQNAVEQQKISAVKQNQQVPGMSASSGAVNAALNIKEKPREWDDAKERASRMFGL